MKRNLVSRRTSYNNDDNNGYSGYNPVVSSPGISKPPTYIDPEAGFKMPIGRRPRGARVKMIGMMIVVVLVGGYSLVSHQERKFMRTQMLEQETKMRDLEIDLSMKFDTQITALKNENAALQRKVMEEKDFRVANQNLKDHSHSLEKQLHNVREEIKKTMHKNEMETKSKTLTFNNIQRMSKEAALAKFGKGPHRFDIHIRFDSHLGRDDGGSITIELASIDDLPHAAHWFLEQVDRKLYDGFSFHRNAGHVIQAGANHKNFLNFEHIPSEQKFRDSGFHSLLFQEYSDKFPHRKYTLGFAGRPGGPEFYINTKDNTKIHGPGGQQNYDVPSDADTCFAKVIDGFDLVDRMYKLPVKPGSYKALKDNVAILSIRRKA